MPAFIGKIKIWFNDKFRVPFSHLDNAERLICVLVGLLGGIFPVPALTCAVMLVIGAFLQLNAPQIAVATAVNFAVTPLEFALIPPFSWAGAIVTGADTTTFTAAFIMQAASQSIGTLLSTASSMLLHAIVAWSVVCIVFLAIAKTALASRHKTVKPN